MKDHEDNTYKTTRITTRYKETQRRVKRGNKKKARSLT